MISKCILYAYSFFPSRLTPHTHSYYCRQWALAQYLLSICVSKSAVASSLPTLSTAHPAQATQLCSKLVGVATSRRVVRAVRVPALFSCITLSSSLLSYVWLGYIDYGYSAHFFLRYASCSNCIVLSSKVHHSDYVLLVVLVPALASKTDTSLSKGCL